MSEVQQFSFTLEQQEDYAFLVRFDSDLPPLQTDEPAPLGKGTGPNPSRLLAASIANCLSASLLFALRKFNNLPGPIVTTVTAQMERNPLGRLRVGSVSVSIQIGSPAHTLNHLERALEQFEEFCVVTQSVREGIPIEVRVSDSAGTLLN